MYLSVVVTLAVVAAGPTFEADTVIRNVTIYDGTGGEPFSGDIAIREAKIVGVGDFEIAGDYRDLDGTGLVAAPGFIDLHNHSDTPITRPATRLNKNYVTQGVTTIVTGNCGGGQVDVQDYLDKIDREGAGTNVAHLVPQGAVRRRIVGRDKRPSTPAELEEMKQLVAAGMRAGAFGMSTGLIYVPSKYADTNELIELAKVVSEYEGIYVSHMRNENTRLLQSVEEALEIGRRGELPVHISHFKASGRAAWGLAADAVRLVAQAREQGQAVTADQYPYIASSTSLGAMVVPDEYRSREKLVAALADPQQATELRARIQSMIGDRSGGASLFIASYAKQREWQGRDLATLSKEQDRPVLDLVLEIQQNGGAAMVNFGMSEEEVRLIMQQPFVATASDGGAKVPDETVPHPRNYGTFPRKIGSYAIANKTLSVAQAIRSATGLPADILRLRDRGYLRPGYVADIVVFDPEEFRDAATFEDPHQYASGVHYLLINGSFAIDAGQVTGKLAGRALRHPSGQPTTN